MEEVISGDLLIECEKACSAIGWNYASIFDSMCYRSGSYNDEKTNVYDEMKKIYESQSDPIHKIIITDKPISIQCILEAIKSKIAYIILPRPVDNLSKLMILQDMYILFDYISSRVSCNFINYKKSFCKKCKTCKINKLKIVNNSEYNLITQFVYFLNGNFKHVIHDCTS